MPKPLTDEDLLERASIDGRVAFAVTAFALAVGLVALLDRVGVPERIVGVLAPVVLLAGLAIVGLLLRSMRISRFHAAGRAVPAPYAGLAFTALSAGLFLPFLPPVPGGTSLSGLLIGFGLGLLLAALVTGPLLRKTGAFSLPDLLAGRFPQLSLRLGIVIVVGAVALLIAAAGFEMAVRGLVRTIAMPRPLASPLIGLILLFIVAPGGAAGVVWAATGAAGILLASLVLPLAIMVLRGASLPFPVIGDRALWQQASDTMATWHGAMPGTLADGGLLIILAIALGIAALGPLLQPAMTCNDVSAARRAGLAALGWSAALIVIVATGMASSALAVDMLTEGHAADALPGFFYAASGKGLLTICGANAATAEAALAACKALPGFAGALRPQDIGISGAALIAGLPQLQGFGAAFTGLVGAGLIAIAITLASSGIHAFGTAIGHDLFFRVRDTTALGSRRLAVARLTMAGAIALIGIATARTSLDPAAMIGLALVFSAAAVAPLTVLSLWPRAAALDAVIALLVGLLVVGLIIALGDTTPSIERLAASALAAFVAACAVGIATSFRHSDEQSRSGRMFVQGVLHGDSDLLNTDRG
ncbi:MULTISPECIES: hypothetical protein [unclassified Beijerinckia]|uniref:hypothetical protein n=1 Tax=unclassified Beijerinckia TaxID=2638183 RepID=UPI0008947676|nr:MULTISPECIES: hypothetical protein [unclassified Beijerinckia]MDH7797348.1 cation/acetate symporter [Beijerinckia sp. GAS462]SEC82004.1 cation/acetate symporter [Beijerinckia sp. 28-YEA-48]